MQQCFTFKAIHVDKRASTCEAPANFKLAMASRELTRSVMAAAHSSMESVVKQAMPLYNSCTLEPPNRTFKLELLMYQHPCTTWGLVQGSEPGPKRTVRLRFTHRTSRACQNSLPTGKHLDFLHTLYSWV